MDSPKIDKQKAYNFFCDLIDRNPEDRLMLVDVIVNYWLFPTQESMTEAELKLAQQNNAIVTKDKIWAIKRVREMTGWGLKEAKDYVEFGLVPAYFMGTPPTVIIEKDPPVVDIEGILKAIKRDYHI